MNEQKIYAALANINSKVQAIEKGRKNKEQNYSFRGIDDAYNELHKYFSEERVVILPKFLESRREERRTKSGSLLIYSIATYDFTFMADDGSSVTITLQGEGMDTGDKSLNKAFSAALKYALLSTFLIPTAEAKDSENETFELAPEPALQPKQKPVMPADRFDKMIAVIKADTGKAAEYLSKARAAFRFTDQQEMILAEWEAAL